MSLYTDRLYPTPADIISISPDLPLELGADNTNSTLLDLCSEAYSHCASILASKLQSVIGATNFNPSGGATALHNASVIYGVRSQSNVVQIRMGQIVMDDLYIGDGSGATSLLGPLHTWEAHWAVVLGYRKLLGRADGQTDRYKTKYDFFHRITSREKWSLLRSTGVPYVRIPFPAPGAQYESGSGTWGNSNLTSAAGGSGSGGTYRVAITWVDQTSTVFYVSPLIKNNAESGPSTIYPNDTSNNQVPYAQVTTSASHVVHVSISTLTPPTGAVNIAQASITGVSQGTRVATGWNVYVGVATGPLYLQNSTPIPVATLSYSLTGDPVLSGYTLGPGQVPEANKPVPDLMMRS